MLKTALLLWDQVHTIVPWEGYRLEDGPPIEMEATELISKGLIPSEADRLKLHHLVNDFVDRPLPAAFFLSDRDSDDREYEMFQDKLLHQTWRMLDRAGMVRPTPRRPSHYTAARPTGLVLMSLLADVCAGKTLTRVTDRANAYASLSGLFVGGSASLPRTGLFDDAWRSEAELVLTPITLEIIDPEQFTLRALIDFRKTELKSGGGRLRPMRHSLSDKIRGQAKLLASVNSVRDAEQIKSEFRASLKDEYGQLREGMGLKTIQAIASKEVLTSVAVGAGAFLASSGGLIPSAYSHFGELASAACGAISVATKFYEERGKLLRENPTAYLYELSKH